MLVNASRRRTPDQGSTLVSVLVTMLVLTLLALAGAALVTNTTKTVLSTGLSSQARASADAGIAAVVAAFRRGGGCPVTPPSSSVAPVYTTTCTMILADSEVRFTARGWDDGSRKEANVEAVYKYTTTPLAHREPALVTRAPLSLAALTIKTMDPSVPASVWVIPEPGVSGDFTCNAGGAIAGSVYLPAGTVLGSGGCTVGGDVYAERSVTIGSGTTIRGDLVSLNGNVSITGGNTISGSIYAKGNVTGSGLSGRFVQSIFAAGNLNLAGGAPVARDRITYGGTFTYPHSGHDGWAVNSVTRTIIYPPSLPTAASWEGITQADLDALVAHGVFTKVNWTGGCTHTWDHPMKAVIEGFRRPTIVDARACSRPELPGQWGDIKLSTDVIFVASSFSLVGQNFSSADGNKHRIWIISPETPGRVCTGVPAINVQGVKMSPIGNSKISGMIFTQCTVHFANASENWQGSIQAGAMTGNPNFWYEPVGFPERDLPDPGGEGGGGAGGLATLAGLVSQRDVP